MTRKNSRPSNKGRPMRPGGPTGAPRTNMQGKPNSPNYRVDMMHHQLAAINKEKRATYQNNHPQMGHPKPFSQNHQQQQHQAKRGYRNISFEVKEDLYRTFMGKVKNTSKSPKEVLSQLISFYNMGKINL